MTILNKTLLALLLATTMASLNAESYSPQAMAEAAEYAADYTTDTESYTLEEENELTAAEHAEEMEAAAAALEAEGNVFTDETATEDMIEYTEEEENEAEELKLDMDDMEDHSGHAN